MNTDHLRSFVKIVETGGITQAAKVLYITPPSLHQQIKLLERDIGFSLFMRKGNSLHLTEAGESFYHSVKRILERLDAAIAKGQQFEKNQNRTLVIGYFLREDLYRIEEFAKAYPQYELLPKEIEWDGSMHRLDLQLLSQHYDVIFCEFMEHHPDLEFIAIPANEVVFAAMVTRKHPFANRAFLTKDDLQNQTVYSFQYDAKNYVSEQIRKLAGEYVTIPFTANRNEVSALCYEGMIFIAEERYLADFPLVVLPIQPPIKEKHGILFPKESHHPALRDYLNFISEFLVTSE